MNLLVNVAEHFKSRNFLHNDEIWVYTKNANLFIAFNENLFICESNWIWVYTRNELGD